MSNITHLIADRGYALGVSVPSACVVPSHAAATRGGVDLQVTGLMTALKFDAGVRACRPLIT